MSLLGLARALLHDEPEHAYTLFVNREDRARFAGWTGAARVLPLCLRPRAARLAFQQVLLPAAAAALRLDVVHSPSFIMPLVRGGARHVLTIHDLTSFSRPDTHVPLRRSVLYRRAVTTSIRRADAVTVPSGFVRGDLLRRFPDVPPERVRVVPWGIDEAFRPRAPEDARRRLAHLRLPERFVLFVGTLEPRKNVRVLLAEAQRDAEIGRGQGDAEAVRIYADAYGRDPEFFSLTRTLDAYRRALPDTTSLVMSPDSDFLRFLKGVAPSAKTPRAAQGGTSAPQP